MWVSHHPQPRCPHPLGRKKDLYKTLDGAFEVVDGFGDNVLFLIISCFIKNVEKCKRNKILQLIAIVL